MTQVERLRNSLRTILAALDALPAGELVDAYYMNETREALMPAMPAGAAIHFTLLSRNAPPQGDPIGGSGADCLEPEDTYDPKTYDDVLEEIEAGGCPDKGMQLVFVRRPTRSATQPQAPAKTIASAKQLARGDIVEVDSIHSTRCGTRGAYTDRVMVLSAWDAELYHAMGPTGEIMGYNARETPPRRVGHVDIEANMRELGAKLPRAQ